MKVTRSTLLVAGLALWLRAAASAHHPEEVLYPVFQFPDDLVPAMDGDLKDWEIVPEGYWTGTADLMETVRGLGTRFDEADLSVRTAVGWNDTHNRLYFAVRAHDDIINVEHEGSGGIHGGDLWEIVVDADHSGGIYNGFSTTDAQLEDRLRSSHAQNYHIFLPPLSADWTMWLWGKAQWTCTAPYAQSGWRVDGEAGGAGTVDQEAALTPFDDLNWVGPDSSRIHDLAEGQVLGISWSFLDYDANDSQYDGFWNLSHMTRMDHTADLLPDFLLAAVEPELIPTVVHREGGTDPARSSLEPNHPNPFNGHTTIDYHLAAAGSVELAVYTAAGQPVRTLVSGHRPGGRHSVDWDGHDAHGRDVASGVYLARLRSGGQAQTRWLVVLR